MPYIKLGANAKVEDIVSLAYRVQARTPAAVQERAMAALLVANPQLVAARTIDKDTVLVVPAVPGLNPSADVAAPRRFPEAVLTDATRNAKQLLKRARELATDDAEVQKNALELLKSKEARADLEILGEEGAALVKRATAAARARAKELEANTARKEKALQRMLADLAEMQKRFGDK